MSMYPLSVEQKKQLQTFVDSGLRFWELRPNESSMLRDSVNPAARSAQLILVQMSNDSLNVLFNEMSVNDRLGYFPKLMATADRAQLLKATDIVVCKELSTYQISRALQVESEANVVLAFTRVDRQNAELAFKLGNWLPLGLLPFEGRCAQSEGPVPFKAPQA